MKINLLIVFLLFFCVTASSQNARNTKPTPKKNAAISAVPSLEELSGGWMEVNILRNFPSVMNFVFGLQTSSNLADIQNLTVPSLVKGGLSCELMLDGKPLTATQSLWQPFGVRRKVIVYGVDLESIIRMPFEQRGVLISG